jgi:glutathione S-transferase
MDTVLNVERLWISPYVFACFVTLKEKGIPFRAQELDTNQNDTKDAGYLARTVTGRVPSLQHGELALSESSAIVEYLEEAHPEPNVLPRSLEQRARCRQLMSWLRSDETAPIREERPTTTMFYEKAQQPLSATAARAAEKLIAVSERLLDGGRATLFDAWCIADSELAFMLHRLILNGDAVPAAIRRYAEGQWQRPSVQEFVNKRRPAR